MNKNEEHLLYSLKDYRCLFQGKGLTFITYNPNNLYGYCTNLLKLVFKNTQDRIVTKGEKTKDRFEMSHLKDLGQESYA